MPIDPIMFKRMGVKDAANAPKPANTVVPVSVPKAPLLPATKVNGPATQPTQKVPPTGTLPAVVPPTLPVAVDNASNSPVSHTPESLKSRLDSLDAIISSELGISTLTLDAIRAHVMEIMVTLKGQPELDSILIDRDVHNVLAFIRNVRVDAIESRAATKVKAAKAVAKKGSLSGLVLPSFTGLDSPIPPNLEGMAKLKF